MTSFRLVLHALTMVPPLANPGSATVPMVLSCSYLLIKLVYKVSSKAPALQICTTPLTSPHRIPQLFRVFLTEALNVYYTTR